MRTALDRLGHPSAQRGWCRWREAVSRPAASMTLRDIRAGRNLLWRGGRKIYAYARGESANDPHTNGEYLLLRHILESGEGADILLDIGANRGDWTAKALQIAQATRRIHVHAFEPSTATRASLSTRFT